MLVRVCVGEVLGKVLRLSSQVLTNTEVETFVFPNFTTDPSHVKPKCTMVLIGLHNKGNVAVL